MAASFTPLQQRLGIAHDDLRLVHPNEQFLCWRCFQRQFGMIFTSFRTRRSHSVSLCGLPLCDWAVAAPRRFHFTKTALTVDRGNSSRAEIWQTDMLERWHHMMVPRWKSLSSSVRLFYCQCLSMEIAWLCSILYIRQQRVCNANPQIWRGVHILLYIQCIQKVFFLSHSPHFVMLQPYFPINLHI